MKRILIALAALLVSPLAWGQISTNVSSTITTTNTFQSIQTSTIGRLGCLIQNNGSNLMYVFFGPITSATKATSYQLVAPTASTQGGAISCATGAGKVLQDQISITGTSGDAYTANVQ